MINKGKRFPNRDAVDVGAALRRDNCGLDRPGNFRLLRFKIGSIVLHRRHCPLQFRVSGLGFVVGVFQIDGVQ